MPTTTDAYVARPDTGIQLETVHYADLGPEELLVEIAAASVCHTDVKTAAGEFHIKPPLVLGHEASGVVKEVGRAVTYVRPGDAVVLSYAACLRCRRCMSGKQAYCDDLFALNFSGRRADGSLTVTDERGEAVKGFFFGHSSLGRLAVVRENCAVKVECTRAELEVFASLGCGVQTGAGAVMNVAKPPIGSCIVVFGGGAVGLSAVLAAKLTSPASLVLVEASEAKLDMISAEIMDGVHVLNPAGLAPDEIAAKLKELTPSSRAMDYALDCVGNEQVILAAHASLDTLGMLLIIGSSATAKLGILTGKHVVKGVTARGTHNGDSVPRVMIPSLIALWRAGQFAFDKLLTRYRFEELDRALDQMRQGEVIKPLLVL